MKTNCLILQQVFFRITSIALPFILLFPFLVAKGEGPTNTPSKDVSVTGAPVKVPEAVASWMDDELNKASRKTLLSKDDFFTKDTARLVGYIYDFKSMMQLFRFTGIPHYVFIDPDGNVLDANFICLDFEEAIKWIQEQ